MQLRYNDAIRSTLLNSSPNICVIELVNVVFEPFMLPSLSSFCQSSHGIVSRYNYLTKSRYKICPRTCQSLRLRMLSSAGAHGAAVNTDSAGNAADIQL